MPNVIDITLGMYVYVCMCIYICTAPYLSTIQGMFEGQMEMSQSVNIWFLLNYF